MITSQITAKPVFGQNPAGFVPLVPNNNGELGFIAGQTLTGVVKFDYADLTFVTDDIPATQDNFLTLVKSYFDVTYLPSVLTDATANYEVEIIVKNVRLDFETVGTTADRSIWTEREYKYFVSFTLKINVN